MRQKLHRDKAEVLIVGNERGFLIKGGISLII